MINLEANTVQVHVAAYDENKQLKFLLLKRSSKEKLYPSVWQVITGTIENGEKAVETALRELKEETGCCPVKLWTVPYVASFFNPYKDCINHAPVFAALVSSTDKIKISDEHDEYKWTDFKGCLDALIIPSHVEGTIVFKKYILDNELGDSYLYKAKR